MAWIERTYFGDRGRWTLELRRWQDWSAVPDYVALIRSGARQQPASVYAMTVYLDHAPQPEARAAATA